MTVFILAAGKQERWNKPGEIQFPQFPIKQLIDVGDGEALLARTVRQLRKRGHDPIIVSHLKELQKLSDRWIEPYESDRRYAVSSFLSTQEDWSPGERIVVLLGDVFYSKKGLDLILAETKPIQFLGRPREIYGVSFTNHTRMIDALNEAIRYSDEFGGKWIGKLWLLYRIVAGLPLDQHTLETKYYTVTLGKTRDFDSQSEYSTWLRTGR